MTETIGHKCPECGRIVGTRKTKFGDVVFNHHAIQTMSSNWSELRLDYAPGHDPDRAPGSKTACPMSGQVVE